MLFILLIKLKKLTMTQKFSTHDKYIFTDKFNYLTKENFTERLKQANLASKNDIDEFIKKRDFDEK